MAEGAPLLPVSEATQKDERHDSSVALTHRSRTVMLLLSLVAVFGFASTVTSPKSPQSSTSTSALTSLGAHIEIIPTNTDFDSIHSVKTTNSYPWLSKDRLVEPFKETNIEVRLYDVETDANALKCDYTISFASGKGVYGNIRVDTTPRKSGTFSVAAEEGGSFQGWFSNTFQSPGQYSISISCTSSEADQSATTVAFRDTISCFYVRRELRELSPKMRDDFLDAFQVMVNTPTREGIKKYGINYKSLEGFEIIHVAGAAMKRVDHLHDGLGLITQHAAMTGAFELAIQSVNPVVSVPYWDYTIDSYEVYAEAKARGLPAADYGKIFKTGVLFSDEWFGRTDFASHRVTSGRWGDQTVPRNYEFETRSAYGFLRAPWNLNPSKYVTRYHKFCGEKISAQYFVNTSWDAHDAKNKLAWPTCDMHWAWTNTEVYDTWYDYAYYIGYQPHGPVHAWIGGIGGGSCEDGTWDELYHSGKITHLELMTIKHNSFYFLKNAYKNDLITMPKHCSADTPVSECKWICMEDFWDTADGEAYASSYFNIKRSHPYYKEVVMRIACETPYWPGDHLEAASPIEASFWPIHPTLDRLTQYKHLVRPFTDKSWDGNGSLTCLTGSNTNCEGHNAYDVTTFSTVVMNTTSGEYEERHLTNQQVRESTNPTSWALLETTESWDYTTIQPGYAMPYVYNHFEWRHCSELGVEFLQASFDT